MIKLTIEAFLDDGWITDEEAAEVDDKYLHELVMEDTFALLEDAKFTFERSTAAKAVGGK